tara:strand:+ start:399 stop:788 length:390 start_codon:yes stop_codon:yes gene_type:complete
MKKVTIHEALFFFLKNGNKYTFWELRSRILEEYGQSYGEPSISAALRDFRKNQYRIKFDLPSFDFDPVIKKKRKGGRGYEYSFSATTLQHISKMAWAKDKLIVLDDSPTRAKKVKNLILKKFGEQQNGR